MIFASHLFLFAFLPAFLIAYRLTPARHRSVTILLGSWAFYGWWRLDFLALLIGTTVFAWAIGNRIAATRGTPAAARWCALGVAGCLGVLGIFKYAGFFTESLTALFGTTPEAIGWHWQIILPIGISFYVFQSISFLVDTLRGDAGEPPSFLDFAAFIALFPQLIAGPILRYKDLAPQFRQRSETLEDLSEGLARFTVGLAKKVIIADSLAPLADLAFAADQPSMALAWAGALAYALQLYFDFSGYSDMAIGLGRMMGFRFDENFRQPYHARSITEFWQRWHISLSVWLRDYLYIPLGGNRRGAWRTRANLAAVMLLGGLWHGAAWTFVAWGAWHGAWLALERSLPALVTAPLARVRTLVVVLLGWVLFRAADLGEAGRVLAGMAGGFGVLPDLATRFEIQRETLAFLALAALVAWAEPWLARRPTLPRPAGGAVAVDMSLALRAFALAALGALAIARLAEQSHSPFLYFQF